MPNPPDSERSAKLTRGSIAWRAPGFSWVQFWCAFGVAGCIAFLHVEPGLDRLLPHLCKSFALAVAFGWLAGRFGDRAWSVLVWVFRWIF